MSSKPANAGGLLSRVRNSLESPRLIGESGSRWRYLKLQWAVALWRLLIIAQIPLVAIVSPERYIQPLWYAFLLLVLAVAYTFFYYWLATRTRAAGTITLHIIDLIACGGLLIAAGEDKLLFIMLFFSYSTLLARPNTRVLRILPSILFLILAYFLAIARIGIMPWDILTNPNKLGDVALFFFWGIGFVGFSAVMERASALELDSHLDKQRRQYRGRLHDDLGNTLCGLHFKIQSLTHAAREDLGRSFAFLIEGYARADGVLERLLAGIDEQVTGTLNESLAGLRERAGNESGLQVELAIPAENIELSPEIHREIYSIVREAVTNAARHARATRLTIAVETRGSRLTISVKDNGDGFSQDELRAKQSRGSIGIENMAERARRMCGVLAVDSSPGAGTTISLQITARARSGNMGRVLDFNPDHSGGGLYVYLVRVRFAMYIWTMIQLFLQPEGRVFSLPLAFICLALTADCLVWIFLRTPMFRLVYRRPWVLLVEGMGFIAFMYITLQSGLPYFFPLYMGVVIMMNGIFLGSIGNLAVTAVIDGGILLVYALAPATALEVYLGGRWESALQHIAIFSTLAISSGLAGEFIMGLESLQLRAIGLALTRQRERMSAETHKQLHSLVHGLGAEILAIDERLHDFASERISDHFRHLESRSTDVKNRLRSILDSLEDAA